MVAAVEDYSKYRYKILLIATLKEQRTFHLFNLIVQDLQEVLTYCNNIYNKASRKNRTCGVIVSIYTNGNIVL